jgi:hypothetical protein
MSYPENIGDIDFPLPFWAGKDQKGEILVTEFSEILWATEYEKSDVVAVP